ncbi:hypothetical protein OEZ85_000331 [Tetradesmus obliquus]|uniref:U-box domain-containing protein n=1 Tax=Tetradesmus obliquus TaxID=3088 RepID=A0ABY8UQV6_TETOB|nr:hypothetical protein OEZ85_000331 [Tetradesmus obliquus]
MIESLTVTFKLCVSIVKLLEEAKHNKKECGSLKRLVETIRAFLQGLEAEAISSAGKEALRHVHEQLQCAQGLLARVANTGPLMSLLSAGDFRREFLHIHRDLSGAFQLLGTGEKLLGQERMQRELSALRAELRSSGSGFFSEQEVIGSSLREVAAACQEQRLPAQTVHRLLLEELDQVPEVAALAPMDLLQELHELQFMAMYGSEGQQAACKAKMGSSEKALVEQLCAALAPRAALADQPLSPSAAAQAPDAYLCPISRDIMLDPMLLVETGQS